MKCCRSISGNASGGGRQGRRWSVAPIGSVSAKASQRLRAIGPHQLSGGERQRVDDSHGAVNTAELLIADEPNTTAPTSPYRRRFYLYCVWELQRELNKGLLFITHNLSIAKMAIQAVMQHGKCREPTRRHTLLRADPSIHAKLLNSEPTGGDPGSAPAGQTPLLEVEEAARRLPNPQRHSEASWIISTWC